MPDIDPNLDHSGINTWSAPFLPVIPVYPVEILLRGLLLMT
jgi:hypothetical protein